MTDYTGYISTNVEIDAMDIPTMVGTPIEAYKNYVLESLLFQDHHGVVRSMFGEYPIAATREQIDALIEILQEWRDKA